MSQPDVKLVSVSGRKARSRNGAFDFTGVDIGTVAIFASKKDALAFAKAMGWPRDSVSLGFNRFNEFYFVGQSFGRNEWKVIAREESAAWRNHSAEGYGARLERVLAALGDEPCSCLPGEDDSSRCMRCRAIALGGAR